MTATTCASREHAAEGTGERPWGSWEVLDEGAGYKVRRLTVRPHSRLPLVIHRYRSEHWMVVSGTASCVVGESHLTVAPGGHVFVPRGAVHRIANDQNDPLLVLEVQLGSYLAEDDIVRLQDDPGRARQHP